MPATLRETSATVSVDPGFDLRGLHLVSCDPRRDGFAPAQAAALLDTMAERLAGTAGIRSVALSHGSPIGAIGEAIRAKTQMIREPDAVRRASIERVGRGYFETIGIPMLTGAISAQPR